jgi:lipopolysaccharide heptosyltransferase I
VKILIVKMSALGDIVHTLPALTALRRTYPAAQITWLIEEPGAPLIGEHPALNRVLIWPRRRIVNAFSSRRWIEAFKILHAFLKEFRSTRYDLVLDFQALFKSGIWVWLARSQRKVGFGRGMDHSEGSHLFLTERVPAVSMEIHALERSLILLEAIGIPNETVVYDLKVAEHARAKVDELLGANGVLCQDKLVVIHPMTRWPTKCWSANRFAAVADALTQKGCQVVFTGSLQDRNELDTIFQKLRHPMLRLDGQLDLKDLVALLQRAHVAVTTDTGPMHMAAALDTPVIAIFGPTAPNRTGPYGGKHRVIRAGVACSPCFSRTCQNSVAEEMACMRRIQAMEVIDAVMAMINSSKPEDQSKTDIPMSGTTNE